MITMVAVMPKLSDDEFELGWDQLEDDEVNSSSVDALAKRVVALVRAPPQP